MVGANDITTNNVTDITDMKEVYASFMRLKKNKSEVDISISNDADKEGKEEG